MINAVNGSRLLRITLLAGLILIIISCGFLTFLFFTERNASQLTRRQDNFYRILREYDTALEQFFGTEREYDYFNRELDRLERNAIGVESWLSILKRRRALSVNHQPSLLNYHNSINRAAAAYPASEPIAAIAAAALVKDSALTSEAETELRRLLTLINDPSFNTFRISSHVLLGDFKSPERAALIPDNIVPLNLSNPWEAEAVNVCLAVLKIMRGDFRGAGAEIQTFSRSTTNNETLRFAAEYHFDFGNLLRSAEIFSMINDDSANIRQADALYLSGYHESAKSIWNILADSLNEISLYNLAVLALEDDQLSQAAVYLEKLNSKNEISNPASSQFGIIRYSRLLSLTEAVSVLQTNSNFPPGNFPMIDLEICKRQSHEWTLTRRIAETWMLLDRHPDSEELHEWAAWHIFFQRRFDETPVLLDRFDRLQFDFQWTNIYRAFQLMIDGNIDMAEDILLSIPPDEADWVVHANLGRIYEERRSASRALIQYELAVLKASDNKTAARLQTRVARCFTALGRHHEARNALLTALDLDPENLTARLELERMF